MKVDLIQIGDYFAYPTQTIHDGNLKIGRVNFIRHDGIVQVDFVDTNAQLLEPIEITPSILENNGFIKKDVFNGGEFWQYIYSHHDNTRDFYCKARFVESRGIDCCELSYYTYGMLSCNVTSIKIRYVHELQHALKLCNIDKEIVL